MVLFAIIAGRKTTQAGESAVDNQEEQVMKYHSSWYPNTGIQHTRAVVALTALTACIERFRPDPESDIAKHMRIITRCVDKCAAKTKKKKLSAGAKRDLGNCFDVLAQYADTSQAPNDGTRFKQWAGLFWCALTFIEDVLASCPAYRDGAEGRKWQELHEATEAVTDALCQLEPGIDEYGTMIYECAAWALEGVDFEPDDRAVAA